WFSWIHIEDEVGIILLALDHPGAVGAINATAQHPVTNKAFSKALGRALHRPAIFPVPPFMLRVLLGQVAEILTTGQRVIPAKAIAVGYQLECPKTDPAWRALLSQDEPITRDVCQNLTEGNTANRESSFSLFSLFPPVQVQLDHGSPTMKKSRGLRVYGLIG